VNTASVDKAPWVISAADQPPALEIVLLRHTVVLSWSQFVYAEGGDDEVQIAFASHDVVVKALDSVHCCMQSRLIESR